MIESVADAAILRHGNRNRFPTKEEQMSRLRTAIGSEFYGTALAPTRSIVIRPYAAKTTNDSSRACLT